MENRFRLYISVCLSKNELTIEELESMADDPNHGLELWNDFIRYDRSVLTDFLTDILKDEFSRIKK